MKSPQELIALLELAKEDRRLLQQGHSVMRDTLPEVIEALEEIQRLVEANEEAINKLREARVAAAQENLGIGIPVIEGPLHPGEPTPAIEDPELAQAEKAEGLLPPEELLVVPVTEQLAQTVAGETSLREVVAPVERKKK